MSQFSRNILFILSFTAINSCIRADLKSNIKNIVSNIICYPFAHKNASKETTKYTQEIAQKLDPNAKVENVKKLNRFGQLFFGYQNAIALPFLDCVIVNDKWIKKLPEEQKRFVIGRTLYNLSNAKEYTIYKYLLPILVNKFVTLTQPENYNELKAKAIKIRNQELYGTSSYNGSESLTQEERQEFLIQFIKAGLGRLISAHFARDLEYEADLEAAKKLNCINGGIKILKDIQNFKSDEKFSNKLFSTIPFYYLLNAFTKIPQDIYYSTNKTAPENRIIYQPFSFIKEYTPSKFMQSSNALGHFVRNLPLVHYFMTNPRTKDRINALKGLAKEQNSQKK